MRLIAVNSYTATAADGVVAMQDYIVVDQLPPVIAEYARGTVAVPISMLDADDVVVMETVCTGWATVGAAFHLYIQELDIEGIAGPLTVMSTPSAAMMAALQPATARAGTLSSGTYVADVGHMHHITAEGDCTLQVRSLVDRAEGFATLFQGEDAISTLGLVTRLVITDAMAVGGPAELTWSVNAELTGFAWEVAAPQFTAPGAILAVELWNRGDGTLLGWFREFT